MHLDVTVLICLWLLLLLEIGTIKEESFDIDYFNLLREKLVVFFINNIRKLIKNKSLKKRLRLFDKLCNHFEYHAHQSNKSFLVFHNNILFCAF